MLLEKDRAVRKAEQKFWPVGAQLIRGWARAHPAP